MKLRLVFMAAMMALASLAGLAGEVDSVLRVLDSEIEQAPSLYTAPKEALLDRLRMSYGRAATSMARFDACRELFEEYRFYQSDSAYAYARRMEEIAHAMGDSVRIMQARTSLMAYFAVVGFFHEAMNAGHR
ncbi:MAG: hypothetical protein K2I39_07985, partial [Muribaculaceae bacterium]|nr:hypothetical protein [Muribaculaceae bacterium]